MSLALLRSPAANAVFHLKRPFITLPDLSAFSPFQNGGGNGSDTQTYHERKILPYRPSQLYAVVSDVQSYPQFVPFCSGSRILSEKYHDASSQTQGKYSMDVELSVGFLAFEESYVSKVTCRPNELVEVVAASSTPLFKSLNTVWRFQPASTQSPHPSTSTSLPSPESSLPPEAKGDDAGPTLVSLDLAFAFSNPVHAAVSSAFFGQVSRMMVQAFEERCLVCLYR